MEWVILALSLYSGGTTWYIMEQSEEIGVLTSERNGFKNVAEACSRDGEQERTNVRQAASTRAVIEEANNSAIEQYRYESRNSIQSDSNSCLITPVGDISNSMVDAQRRLLEELRSNRLQSRP